MAVFQSMNHIPGQRGHVDESVRFVMRRDVVNSILAEISRTHRRIEGGLTREHEAALGVRVINLDRLAIHRVYAG